MKLSRLVRVGGAVLVSGCLFLVYRLVADSRVRDPDRRSAIEKPVTAAGEASEVDRVKAQVSLLHAQVQGLKSQVAAQPSSAQEPEQTMTEEERRAEAERRHLAVVGEVEAAFEREPIDARWSAATSDRVLAAINKVEALRAASPAIECHSQTCRMEIGDDGSGALLKDFPLVVQQFADVLPRGVAKPVKAEDGRQRMVLFLMGPDRAQAATAKN